MTNPAEVDPWLANVCEQIAVDTFEELVEQLNRSSAATSTMSNDEFKATARQLIEARIANLIGHQAGPEMVFQPIVMLETRQTIGYEALSRFPSGPSPALWFRDARSVGMSSELELSALMKAFDHLGTLRHGLLCVNVSTQLLDDHRLYELLGHVNANRVVVEITQPDAVTEGKRLLDGLTSIRSLGLRIAFDDVGTGFLGLQQMLGVEPEIIKLSASLTQGVEPGPDGLDPARQIVNAARRSGTFVIAKCVESQADVDTLYELGVEAAQGFFLGEPQPACAFAA